MNCMIVGVGGQGTILASKLLAQTAINAGLCAKTSETIGMAQRGGSVVSHIRIDEKYASPNIPLHQADLLIGFEPTEAVRNMNALKKDGTCIVSTKGISTGTMLDFLNLHTHAILVDGEKLSLELGTSKALNVILLGAAIGAGALPFSLSDFLYTLETYLPPKLVKLNCHALKLGYDATRGNKDDDQQSI